jgi:quercetin dioxygenase-like cupin family protein
VRITVLLLALSLTGTVAPQGPKITSLLSRDLAGTPGKELSMITVEYPPGASDPAHTHDAQVMVFVKDKGAPLLVPAK